MHLLLYVHLSLFLYLSLSLSVSVRLSLSLSLHICLSIYLAIYLAIFHIYIYVFPLYLFVTSFSSPLFFKLENLRDVLLSWQKPSKVPENQQGHQQRCLHNMPTITTLGC